MPLPDSASEEAGGPAADRPDVVFAVHGAGDGVVAASDDYQVVARALGCSSNAAPSWLPEVASRLANGEAMVCREDRSIDGRVIVASEHMQMAGTADNSRLIASRYRFRSLVSPQQTPVSAAQRLADVLRLSSEWLYETDADLRLTYISDRVFDDIGALPAELLGTALPDFGVFDAGPQCFAEQQDPRRRRPFTDRLADVRHARGGVRRVRFSGVPVFVEDEFVGYRGVARDETRQQSAADAADRAEARLTVGLAASRDGFAVFDADGLLVCANPQIALDLGRREPLPAGIELGKLLNHALRSGWFVDTDAPTLSATRPSLCEPDSQSMIEIELADHRRILFCASRTDCNDVLLISTDITGLSVAKPQTKPNPIRLRKSA